jgi:starch phosphorylase
MVKRNYKQIKIKPIIPENLKILEKLSKNFWFSWNPAISELFLSMDYDAWQKCQSNPYKMLIQLDAGTLQKLSTSKSFMSRLHAIEDDVEYYFQRDSEEYLKNMEKGERIAYFCAEYALHESFPIYSGGLGILAGDHIKTASDMNLPLVAIGLLYRNGYFSQYLNDDGWQQEDYPVLETFSLPIEQVCDNDNKPILVEIELPGRNVYAQAWHALVGRVDLYLLDTNIPENSYEDRKITNRLYIGDKEMRIQQEMVLGVGGIRLLDKINKYPTVVHMNEGHSAFSSLERIRYYIQNHKLSYNDAFEIVKANTIFTTHTPIPAGNEEFEDKLIDKYLGPFVDTFKLSLQDLLNQGRVHTGSGERFGMTPFCIRSSSFVNGVSRLHGEVARNMWREIWTDLYNTEIPIDHITNGVHVPTWIADELARLFTRYVDPQWNRKIGDPEMWARLKNIPYNELWKAQERLKERLIAFVRKKTKDSLVKKNASPQEIEDAENILSADSLTIGFARRFATYKRAHLLFKDPDRLKKILNNSAMPVQFVFAGKAHPADKEGKQLIANLVHIARKEGFKNKIVFLEDYDMESARYLVQGIDVWLNTPRRPNEACGTSGMKVGINGGLNISIPDGWWDEAFMHDIGWTIGRGEEYADYEYQDFVESKALYDILEDNVIPMYFMRREDNIPREWVSKMRHSMMHTLTNFNSERMVAEYLNKYYNPGSRNYVQLTQNNFSELDKLCRWLDKIKKSWPNLSIVNISHTKSVEYFEVEETIHFEAEIMLDGLVPEDVGVTLFYGKEENTGKIMDQGSLSMTFSRKDGEKSIYEGIMKPQSGGVLFYSLRVLPEHPLMTRKLNPGLVTWF